MLLLTLGFALAADPVTLQVTVDGLRNDDGLIRVAVHSSADTFPGGVPAFTASVEPHSRSAVASITLPPGAYAVSVLHDEDEDSELDTGLFGIPKEGVGASTDVRRMGPPRFRDSVFELTESTSLAIGLTYLL
ncbi:MAG: hypothetical protein ACI8PZ_000053 [Myxococcota bacterium]|jgi:uncharacterized protein (DUF2141 family)